MQCGGTAPAIKWLASISELVMEMAAVVTTGEDLVEPHNETRTSDSKKQSEIKAERRREQSYREYVEHRAANPAGADGPRSGQFVGWLIPEIKPARHVQFEGRVALVEPDEGLGGATEFYLGRAYGQVDGIDVYNWRSPFGRLFFDSSSVNEQIPNIACVRTFHHRDRIITDFIDDILCERPPLPIFGRGPTAKSPEQRRSLPPESRLSSVHDGAEGPKQTSQTVAQADQTACSGEPPVIARKTSLNQFRAESLLRDRLRAPRTEKLAPVLSTLQPEQYRIITASAADSTVVEGGPGTGKTIIASHRAAFFVGPDTFQSGGLEGHVLVIGPTPQYADHIGDVINELVGDRERIKVCTFAELEELLLGGGSDLMSQATRWPQKVETSLEELIQKAKTDLTQGRDTELTVPQIYEFVRTNGRQGNQLTNEEAWARYLSSLPRLNQVKESQRRPWLLALIEYRLTKNSVLPRIGHVIVDEAQDMKPWEWSILRSINSGKSWTILGDLNQRRDDQTFRDWSDVLHTIGQPQIPRYRLMHGYRSTVPILKFANGLLPPGAQPPIALQAEGPDPVIVSTSPEALAGTVVQQIDRLRLEHPGGTIAVITTAPGLINPRLQREPPRPGVIVSTFDKARGLEFDAVIVVEPADFPHNDRRFGPLYTALTRPNRELVVVHSKPLPPKLQTRSVLIRRPVPRIAAEVRLKAAAKVKKVLKGERVQRRRSARASRRRRGRKGKGT